MPYARGHEVLKYQVVNILPAEHTSSPSPADQCYLLETCPIGTDSRFDRKPIKQWILNAPEMLHNLCCTSTTKYKF